MQPPASYATPSTLDFESAANIRWLLGDRYDVGMTWSIALPSLHTTMLAVLIDILRVGGFGPT